MERGHPGERAAVPTPEADAEDVQRLVGTAPRRSLRASLTRVG